MKVFNYAMREFDEKKFWDNLAPAFQAEYGYTTEYPSLEKELAKAESDIAFIRRKLDNPSFVAKAPAAVVEGEKAKLAKAEATREGVLASIAALQ